MFGWNRVSFPRKRESRAKGSSGCPWVPAFAGTTLAQLDPGQMPHALGSQATENHAASPFARRCGEAEASGHLPGESATKAACSVRPGASQNASRQ